MRNLDTAQAPATRTARALGGVSFGWWYFADGAKEAAPA
jgi:hypothetical protein